MAKKVGVILSGCGVFDGSEIHEAVLTMLFLDQAGAEIIAMAPNMEQLHVIDHLNQTQTSEKRNVLVESARIARGEIKDIRDMEAADLDAVIIPGGFGAAKNLSNFAVSGPDAEVYPQVARLLNEMAEKGKPIGAICIAPATLTKALTKKHPEVTIGNDKNTAAAIEAMGGQHIVCTVEEVHVDRANKLVTTPAYMIGPGIKDVAKGIEKLVSEVLALA